MSPKFFCCATLSHINVAISPPRESRPCRWLVVAYRARRRRDLRRLVRLLVESIVQNRDHSGKQSQILSRSPTMQAVSPAPRNGSRRPRSSPATPSAAPCSARGSNKRRASRGSRGLAPLQSGNFQDLTRVDCRILVTLDCRILVTLDCKILVTETGSSIPARRCGRFRHRCVRRSPQWTR